MKIKIIMLSGGYDSTGLLFWALSRYPESSVVAHHICLVNAERRHALESEAVARIEEYAASRALPCRFSRSKVENMNPHHYGRDIVHAGFMGAQIAAAAFYEHRRHYPQVDVYTGGTIEDGVDDQIEQRDGIWKKHAIFNAYFADWKPHWPKPTISAPMKDATKESVARHIPAELMPHIVTCRRPVISPAGVFECGACVSCARKRLIAEVPGVRFSRM